MNWFGVDGARCYLAGRDPSEAPHLDKKADPTRKVVYGMVEQGLRVARLGEPTVDTRGRRRQGRMVFAAEWIDAFLEQRANSNARLLVRRAS